MTRSRRTSKKKDQATALQRLKSEADHYRKLEVGASTPFARELFAEKAKALNKKMAKMTQRNGGGAKPPGSPDIPKKQPASVESPAPVDSPVTQDSSSSISTDDPHHSSRPQGNQGAMPKETSALATSTPNASPDISSLEAESSPVNSVIPGSLASSSDVSHTAAVPQEDIEAPICFENQEAEDGQSNARPIITMGAERPTEMTLPAVEDSAGHSLQDETIVCDDEQTSLPSLGSSTEQQQQPVQLAIQAIQEEPIAASGSVAPAKSISSIGEDITSALLEGVDAAASITLLAASPAADKSSSQAEQEQQPKELTLDKQAQTEVSSGSDMGFSGGRQKYGLLVTVAVEVSSVLVVLTPWPFRGAVRAWCGVVITAARAAEAATAAIIG